MSRTSRFEYSTALSIAMDERSHVGASCTNYRDPRTIPAGAFVHVSDDGLSGFIVCEDGELVGLFSRVRGRGDELVRAAIKAGARRLDCFDGYLTELYARHGFREVRREPNWTPGGPDVVYMALEDEPYCSWCTDGIDPGDDWDALCEAPGCKPRTLY